MKKIEINIPDDYEVIYDDNRIAIGLQKIKPSYNTVLEVLYTNSEPPLTYQEPVFNDKMKEKISAMTKLMNIAKFLNGPDWKYIPGNAWEIVIGPYDKKLKPLKISQLEKTPRIVYFKSSNAVKEAIDMLGEKVVRLALSTEW